MKMNYFFLKCKRDISMFETHANQKMFKCGSDKIMQTMLSTYLLNEIYLELTGQSNTNCSSKWHKNILTRMESILKFIATPSVCLQYFPSKKKVKSSQFY